MDTAFPGSCVSFPTPSGTIPLLASDGLFPTPALSYAAATQAWSLSPPASSYVQTFQPSDRDAAPPANTVAYTRSGDRLAIETPTPGGAALDYVRRVRATLGGAEVICTLGVATHLDDPAAGPMVAFAQAQVSGTAYDRSSGALVAYSLSGSTATLALDRAALTVTTSLHLVGSAPGLPAKDFGTFNGTGGLLEANGSYYGSFATGTGSMVFHGGFYGPQDREFGYVFRQAGAADGLPVNTDLMIVGTVTGKR